VICQSGAVTDHNEWDLIATPWHLDEHIPAFPVPVNAAELTVPSLPPGPAPGRITLLQQTIATMVARAAHPLLLTGDCLTALGAVAGLQRRHRDLAVVWLDAHGDFNTPAISISGYLAGMPLAMLTGRAPEPFCDRLRLRPIADTSVVLAGARDLDPAERDALEASGVRRVPADPAALTAALAGLSRTPVYLHLDVDVIDGAELPGLRFPTASGPSLAQIEACLAAVGAAADVAAACIACAWLPDRVGDQAARDTITRLARALGLDLTWPAPAG
jgi:arginase